MATSQESARFVWGITTDNIKLKTIIASNMNYNTIMDYANAIFDALVDENPTDLRLGVDFFDVKLLKGET